MSVLPARSLSAPLALVLAVLPCAAQDGAQAEPPAQEELAPVQVEPAPAVVDEFAFEGALIGAKDGEGFAETPGYRRLVELISRHTAAEMIEKGRTELEHAAVLTSPEAWRGKIVHVRGLVIRLEAVKLASPLASRTDVYRAFITEADGSEGVVVDFLHDPPEIELERDVVDVEGVFFRTVGYENRKGDQAVAPYLVARNLRKLEDLPGRTTMDPMGKILLGAAAAFVVLRVLMTVRRAKSRRQPSPTKSPLP